jgi:hypothetical protein
MDRNLLKLLMIASKNSCAETSKMIFDQIYGHWGIAKLTHKINCHTFHTPSPGVRPALQTDSSSSFSQEPSLIGIFLILIWCLFVKRLRLTHY